MARSLKKGPFIDEKLLKALPLLIPFIKVSTWLKMRFVERGAKVTFTLQ